MKRKAGNTAIMMMELKLMIFSGRNCAVATATPDKFKKDFKEITGYGLCLEKRQGDIYKASLLNH